MNTEEILKAAIASWKGRIGVFTRLKEQQRLDVAQFDEKEVEALELSVRWLDSAIAEQQAASAIEAQAPGKITTSQTMDLMKLIELFGDQKLADAFMDAMVLRGGERARRDIGYMTGYFDSDTADRMLKVFKASHPVFGNCMPRDGGKTAFEAGLAMGRRSVDFDMFEPAKEPGAEL